MSWIREKVLQLFCSLYFKSNRGKQMKSFLDGYKSLIGLVLLAVLVILAAFGINLPDYAWQLVGVLLGAGVVHKFQKLVDNMKEMKQVFEEQANGK